jgi:uncharacterized OsmC-like protein
VDLRALQRPLKDLYRSDPSASKIHLEARASQSTLPISCSVDIGRAIYAAEAHQGVGGPGTAACSGDLLLGALAACAQITCQMVAAAMGVPVRGVEVVVSGELDLRGTLGITRDVPVGFESISCHYEIDAPDATPEQLAGLRERTERYCVVFQTLSAPPRIESTWSIT